MILIRRNWRNIGCRQTLGSQENILPTLRLFLRASIWARMKTIECPTPQQITDMLFSRRQVADRWSTSIETVKRRQKQGLLTPIYLSKRQVRYKLSQIIGIEEAGK